MSSRPPSRPVISQPHISAFYDTADLVDLEYREQNLRQLGHEDSIEGIVVSLDDLESDSGQFHEYAEPEGRSSADTGNFNLAETSNRDVCDTDVEHLDPENLVKKVFGNLVDDPLWPYIHGVQLNVPLQPPDWDKLVELVYEHKDVYQLFSFHYDYDHHILAMSTPTSVHERVTNLLADLLSVSYGGPCVINIPGFKGVLTTDTKRKYVGPLPSPADPSLHARKLVGRALLVPDGAVTLGFPLLMQDEDYILRVKHGEHVVGVFEQGFYETWDHLVFRFGQYKGLSTLNRNPDDLPVFMLTVKVIEEPKYQSPSSKCSPEQKRALQDHWTSIDDSTLRKHEPSDAGDMLTGKVTIGGHTFCGELEAYVVLVGFFNQHRADLEEGYQEQWLLKEWVKRGYAIKVRRTYGEAETDEVKRFTNLWKSVFTKYQLRIWEKGGEAWQAYVEAQLAKDVNVYEREGVRDAWREYLASAPFNKPESEAFELPLSDLIDAIAAGAITTATERFDSFKREFCGFSPDPPAREIDQGVSAEDELQDDVQNAKRKFEQWLEKAEEQQDVKRPRQADNVPQ